MEQAKKSNIDASLLKEAVPISLKKEDSGVYYWIVPDGTVYASTVPLHKLKKEAGLGIVPIIGAVATVGAGLFNVFKSKNDRRAAEELAKIKQQEMALQAQQQQTLLLVGGGLGAALLLVLLLK